MHPSHLLLSQNEDSPGFDWVPGCQSLPSSLHLPTLVGLPNPISESPADTDVLPLILWQGQGQLRHLQARGNSGRS